MNRRTFLMLPWLSCLPGCTSMPQDTGPGMIVTFTSLSAGHSVHIKGARLPSGQTFSGVGLSLGGIKTSNWRTTGATEGAVPDGRELPEWVEFEWQEWPYPYPKMPSEPRALQEWGNKRDGLSRSLPHKSARVLVRSRVPQDVVDEVIESKRKRKPHELPDKMLWVYFIWTDASIKFRWALKGCCGKLREGGDEIDAP